MVYGGGGIGSSNNNDESDRDSRVGSGDCYSESADSVLDSLPNSYSKLNIFSL